MKELLEPVKNANVGYCQDTMNFFNYFEQDGDLFAIKGKPFTGILGDNSSKGMLFIVDGDDYEPEHYLAILKDTFSIEFDEQDEMAFRLKYL
jgi:hypothetical protein